MNDTPNNDNVITPFHNFLAHVSAPSIPLTEVQKVRFSAIAEDLQDAKIQGYIEANFGIQALKLLQAIIPLIAGAF